MSRSGSLVAARITQAPACEIIDLDESEKNIYRGAGRALAVFEKGALTKLLYFGNWVYPENERAGTAMALKVTRQWLDDAEFDGGANTEIWFVHCSCYQLCEPRRIATTVAPAMAFLAGKIGEEIFETLYG